MKKHHRIHGPKSDGLFKCDHPECEFAVTHRGRFNKHLRTHLKSFTCQICAKAFSNVHRLRRHLLSHMESKLFACELCPFTCGKRNTYEDHVRKHTAELLKCQKCEFTTTYKTSLNKHVSTFHVHSKNISCSNCLKQATLRN